MHDRFQFMKTVRALAQNVQQQIYFAGRLFFQRHYSRTIDKKKNANTEMLALLKRTAKVSVRIENPIAAARQPGQHVAAAEPKVGVRGEHRILEQRGRVIIRIDRVERQVICENGIVRREGEGHDLINTNPGPRESTVQTADEPSRVTNLRSVKQSGLLDAAAKLSMADELVQVIHAAPEFPLRIGASAGQPGRKDHDSKEGECFT